MHFQCILIIFCDCIAQSIDKYKSSQHGKLQNWNGAGPGEWLPRACQVSFFETLSGGTSGTGGGACSGGGPRQDAGRTSTCTESVRDKDHCAKNSEVTKEHNSSTTMLERERSP